MKPTAIITIGDGVYDYEFSEKIMSMPLNVKATINLYDIPDGYKLVPIKPTEQQLFKAGYRFDLDVVRLIYRKMIEAAPSIEDI